MFAKRTNWNLQSNRLSAALEAHRDAGKPLIDLTLSNPTQCGFQYDALAILDALRNPTSLKYEPHPQGLEVARRAVAEYYAGHRTSAAFGDVFLTTSTSEAYSFVFRTLCDFGDEVLIPAPSYPLFEFLADIQDVRLVRYPLIYDHGWQIDFHLLERAITPRARAVIVVNPNNPTGNFCKEPERRALNEICAAREIAIIADEVFLDFSLNGETQSSFAGNTSALTFTLSGISKICGLPQMKAAWIVLTGPSQQKNVAQMRLEVIADTYLSMNTPIQWALPVLLECRHEFRKQVLARVQENLSELDMQISQNGICSRLQVEGGWNVIVRIPKMHSDEAFAVDLLTKPGVYLHPGDFYDFGSEGFLVASLIVPESHFAGGMQRVLALAAQSSVVD